METNFSSKPIPSPRSPDGTTSNDHMTSIPLPSAWIDRIFSEFSAMYGKHFANMWYGADVSAVKNTWANRLAGLSGAQIAHGMKMCERLNFPPTMPEFKAMCIGVDYQGSFNEAARQQYNRTNGTDKWPSRAIFWAAQKFGPHDLMQQSYGPNAKRWAAVLDEQIALAPSLPPIPEPRIAIPPPGGETIPNEELRNRLKALVGKMKRGMA